MFSLFDNLSTSIKDRCDGNKSLLWRHNSMDVLPSTYARDLLKQWSRLFLRITKDMDSWALDYLRHICLV